MNKGKNSMKRVFAAGEVDEDTNKNKEYELGERKK